MRGHLGLLGLALIVGANGCDTNAPVTNPNTERNRYSENEVRADREIPDKRTDVDVRTPIGDVKVRDRDENRNDINESRDAR